MMDGTLGIKDIVTAIEYEITHLPVPIFSQEEASSRWRDGIKTGGGEHSKLMDVTELEAKRLIKNLKMIGGKAKSGNYSYEVPDDSALVGIYMTKKGRVDAVGKWVVEIFDSEREDLKYAVEAALTNAKSLKMPPPVKPMVPIFSQEEKLQKNGLTKWMLSEENKKWGMSKASCYLRVTELEAKRVISHFKMVSDDGHYFHTKEEPEAVLITEGTPDRVHGNFAPSLEIYFTLWKGDLNSLKKFITEVNQLLSTKQPVPIFSQEEAKAASPILWSKFERFYTGRLRPEFKSLWRAINQNWGLKLDPESKKVPNYSNEKVDFLYTTDVCDLYQDYFINVTGLENRKKIEAFAKQFMEAGGKLPVPIFSQEEMMNELYNNGRWFRDKGYWIRAITKAEADVLIKKYKLSGRSAPFAKAITGDLGSTMYKYNTCVMTDYVTETGGILPMAALTDHLARNPKKETEGKALIDDVIRGGDYVKPPVPIFSQEESRLSTILNEVGWAKAKAFATANGWWIGGRTLGLRIDAKQADKIIRQFKMQAVAGGPTWKFEGIVVTKRSTEGYDKLDVNIHDYSASELYQVVTMIDQIVKSEKPPVPIFSQEEAKIIASDIAMLKDAYPDWTFSTTSPGRTINRAWIVASKPAAEAIRNWIGPAQESDVVTVDSTQEPIIVSVRGKYASTAERFKKLLFTTDSMIKKHTKKPMVPIFSQEEAAIKMRTWMRSGTWADMNLNQEDAMAVAHGMKMEIFGSATQCRLESSDHKRITEGVLTQRKPEILWQFTSNDRPVQDAIDKLLRKPVPIFSQEEAIGLKLKWEQTKKPLSYEIGDIDIEFGDKLLKSETGWKSPNGNPDSVYNDRYFLRLYRKESGYTGSTNTRVPSCRIQTLTLANAKTIDTEYSEYLKSKSYVPIFSQEEAAEVGYMGWKVLMTGKGGRSYTAQAYIYDPAIVDLLKVKLDLDEFKTLSPPMHHFEDPRGDLSIFVPKVLAKGTGYNVVVQSKERQKEVDAVVKAAGLINRAWVQPPVPIFSQEEAKVDKKVLK